MSLGLRACSNHFCGLVIGYFVFDETIIKIPIAASCRGFLNIHREIMSVVDNEVLDPMNIIRLKIKLDGGILKWKMK